MNYAAIKTLDVANGPGIRTSVFVSGCTRHCKECFQPQTWDFDYGQPFTQEVINQILDSLKPSYVAGLTVLGGEPFEPQNQEAVADLLMQAKEAFPNKSFWAFTGYTIEELTAPTAKEILSYLDVLVDGPFQIEKKDLTLRFRGSSNQRLIDLKKTRQAGTLVLWDDGYKRGEQHAERKG